MDFLEGEVIAIDKPYEWTSFGLVAKVRWLLTQHLGRKIKVGHAGTLDPLATGVVLLCTGKATKRIDELQAQTKEYTATLRLGATSPRKPSVKRSAASKEASSRCRRPSRPAR